MAPYWQPDEYYNDGDVVEFEGVEYKTTQAHSSQDDSTPPTTPDFWERLRSGGRRYNREEKSGRDRKPLRGPPDFGKQQEQMQRVVVDEVTQSKAGPRLDREQQGGECKPQAPRECPPDAGRNEQQMQRVEVEEVTQNKPGPRLYREQQSGECKPQAPRECPPDAGQNEQQTWQRIEVEEIQVSQGRRHDHEPQEEHWGKAFKPQTQRAEVENVSPRPRQAREPDEQEHWGKAFKPQTQRAEVEEVSQRPRQAREPDEQEQWGKDFKPPCRPDHGQKEHQTLLIDPEYEEVAFPDELDTVAQRGQEKRDKRWYDIEDKRKIGGGILAGVAALGAGYMAYNHYRDSMEKKAARSWSANNWITESQARTQQWRAGRHNAPIAWIWNEGRSIPRDAIQGGEERGESVYICRVYHQGGIMVGKASSAFKKGAVIGYKKDEIHYDKYEILVGDPRTVRWVTCTGKFNLGALHGARPIEGGREPDGCPICIAQAPYRGAVYPGKACEVYGDGCFIPYDDTEKKIKEYAVLCYA